MPSPLVSHYRSAAKRSKDRSPSRIGSRKWRISPRASKSSPPPCNASRSSLLSTRRGRGERYDYSYLTDHSRFSSGWSTPVKVTGGSKPRLISSQCPRWVRRPTSSSSSSFSSAHESPFHQFSDRIISHYSPPPAYNQYRISRRGYAQHLPSFLRDSNIFTFSLHLTSFGSSSLESCPVQCDKINLDSCSKRSSMFPLCFYERANDHCSVIITTRGSNEEIEERTIGIASNWMERSMEIHGWIEYTDGESIFPTSFASERCSRTGEVRIARARSPSLSPQVDTPPNTRRPGRKFVVES